MPFVQRVVQPVNVAQATAASLGHASTRFHCAPGKCKNNNCINKQSPEAGTDVADCRATSPTSPSLTRVLVHVNGDGEDGAGQPHPPAALPMKKLKQHVEFLSTSPTHGPSRASQSLPNSRHPSQQRPAMARNASAPHSPTAGSSKVVSGHEFDSISNITLSNALRQLASLVLIASDIFDDLQRDLQSVGERAGRVQRKIAAVERRVCAYDPKMVTVPESDLLTFAQRKEHYETDKSFQQELFTGDTRPLSVRQLYTEAGKDRPVGAATAGALAALAQSNATATGTTPPRSISFNGDGTTGAYHNGHDVLTNGGGGGGSAEASASEDYLICVSDFGNANRKLRTRIDAEIEIRLPAAIEDLRKWTSSEALGDVTVTPDCMHHVDTSISTSIVIGDSGVHTPALSPSVLSADAADALYAQNLSQAADSSSHHHHHPSHHHNQALLPNDINKDVPLNHRLPSPEEQTKQIALKYPAEVISVNISGKNFQRMCAARRSTAGCFAGGTTPAASSSSASPENGQTEANNLDDNVQTVSRRSRSRKVRGKRRNTIAGIDQKEIQDAANGNGESSSKQNASSSATSPAPAAASADTPEGAKKSKKFGRSKSSDILKKESVALPYDKGKSTLTRLNSLKQWGRNRFKFMHRAGELNGLGESSQLDTSGCSSQNSSAEKPDSSSHGSPPGLGSASVERVGGKSKASAKPKRDIDEECVVHDLIAQKSESRFSHERKPSYSSSEKSMSVSSSGQLRGKLQLSSTLAAANVKMRETATLNRQRRNGLHGLAGKDEQPHSSSGNWSASSESGRASIGSEITMQPKSSASNTSLNVSSFQPCNSSGPPSSMMSRRRFLNTSASSSVTSEGTATPELQTEAGAYPNHLDDETSSAYSCDTEGYYTSFHMDSGLRTLKEEEPPMTPLQQSLHTSSYSFGSQSNQTVLNAENEYELYGRGSTSTTTSSAGTVCTTLLNGAISGPDVPERTSSLGKHSSGQSQSHSQSNSTSASSSTLERSYSSSTIGSTLERTGTIKRNVKMAPNAEDAAKQEDQQQQRSAMPLPGGATELEFSESSDLEGVERIERIKQKTAITSKRIPSMCIITPTTSDDDEHQSQADRTLTNLSVDVDVDQDDAAEPEQRTPTNANPESSKDHNLNELKQTPTKALSGMFEKLKVKLVPGKSSPVKPKPKPASASAVNDDELYDLAGEYVTIADISNNNNNHRAKITPSGAGSSLGIYYSNDIVRRGASASASASATSEYVSLNELPQHLRRHATHGSPSALPLPLSESGACAQLLLPGETAAAGKATPPPHLQQQRQRQQPTRSEGCGVPMYAEISELREEKSLVAAQQQQQQQQQRRVRTTAEGRVIYDSDSLKRRKGAHTTFAPGPYVKETESALLSATRDAATGESATSAAAAAAGEPGSIEAESTATSPLTATTKSAKLLLLSSGGIAGNHRKVANVRPIVAKSPLSKIPQSSSMAAYQSATVGGATYQEQKQLLANHTNPFYETIAAAAAVAPATGNMMPSPSGKSNSSTGSTATNSSSSTASAHSGEEGYQRFSNIYEQVQPAQTTTQPTDDSATPFQRSAPIYWTLQSRRNQQKAQPSGNITCRDDLYATPIRRADRLARAAAATGAAGPSVDNPNGKSNISPIVPRTRGGAFLTSTPTRDEVEKAGENAQVPPMKQPSRNWSDDAPERLNTCADRIGQSKTTLMDFKKLLLAKSAKTSPVQRKMSAVELLKKSCGQPSGPAPTTKASGPAAKVGTAAPGAAKATINSSLKLLDLSGSPKTFANRRMLRQGQFGSPSKTFVPKTRGPVNVVAAASAAPRTDIMSTTIPEVNSEEDHSNTSGGSRASSEAGETAISPPVVTSSYDLKRNFFLQTEQNNFMRGEFKHTFAGKGGNSAGSSAESNKCANAPLVATALPSFETAL
ncbi:uncharacterized protein YMR317W isoform X2 [Drosophila pseudoobscura]|uniref:Uncharacterized protein YMR317W isoform X2 n=1 Tax=Drosophila pseudoobscura pseudoobscura TaxID=46245 RepID=A0A6I8V613_DROPS|nr:uncharacterized protein YMR317W isoform X2 [Drosophila pseudoobscura]